MPNHPMEALFEGQIRLKISFFLPAILALPASGYPFRPDNQIGTGFSGFQKQESSLIVTFVD
jgi:hypothetical protein